MMYRDINQIYKKIREVRFINAVSFVIAHGYDNIWKYSEFDIDGLTMVEPKWRENFRTLIHDAKNIVNATNGPTELLNFCTGLDLFDTTGYSGRLHKKELEYICHKAVSYIMEHERTSYLHIVSDKTGIPLYHLWALGYRSQIPEPDN